MPHVSSRATSKKVLGQIYKLLFVTMSNRITSQKRQEAFFNELFTPTEKIMLGKRLAAISLLSRGVSPYKTGQVLQLSESTTNRYANGIQLGKYKEIMKICEEHRTGPVERYLKKLFKPLPSYGTGPSSLLKR